MTLINILQKKINEILTKELTEELGQNFIDFSYEANCQRAFADARDGLKPGQRACLWEMYNEGYASNKPHVKSAKVQGGVIANWWPHGDAAIYETFARMSQNWINNIPECDWHGANGSVQISGEPAAPRYTEVRLAKAIEEGMLGGIKKKNVPMIPNFSEDDEWPQVLPALIPRLMINGCQGIGSTIANVWLPHNLSDLAEVIKSYLETGEIDYNNIAPDFPTGGIIINKKDLPAIYKTGKGKVVLRGKAEIKDNNILITEIPYQTFIEPLIAQIKELVTKDEIKGITNITNKSDKKRLLIEVECDGNPAAVLSQLYKKTNLQKSFSANQFALVGKTPKLLTLKEYIDIYVQHNYECIKKEYQYDLKEAEERLEIVEGLIKALEDIDNIIKMIKESNSVAEAQASLIKKYSFTERQAKAIVDMKLGRLAHLEKIKLNEEKTGLVAEIAECKDIIGNVQRQREIYLTRFDAFVKKYKSERKTELTHIEIKPEEKEVEEIIPEDVVIVATQSGFIKRVPASAFKVQKKGGKGVKSKDDSLLDVIKTNTIDTIMFFTTKGKMYRCSADLVPEGTNSTKGVLINSLIKVENDEQVIAITSLHRKTTPEFIIFVTKNGLIKKSYLSEYTQTNRNGGVAALKVKEGDEVVKILFQDTEEIMLITKKGMSIRFETKGIAPLGRLAQGVKGINLGEEDVVVSAMSIHKVSDQVGVFTTKGYGKKVALSEFPVQGRGGKGLLIYKPTDITGDVVYSAMISDEDLILLCGNKTNICFSAGEVPSLGRVPIGSILIKDNTVLSATKI